MYKRTALTLMAVLPVTFGLPAQAQTGKDVTIVIAESPQVIEPCESSLYGVGIIVKQNVNETLTELNPATGESLPRLATGWERVDDATWRFHLREGVKFHDGTDFDAEAAAYSIKRTMDQNLKCMTRGKFFTPGSFEPKVVDAHTLDIVTDPAQPILPTLMTTMAIVSPKTPMGEASQHPVGTGPYEFDSWSQGQRVVLKRFDGYWGETPEIETATYIFRNDSAVQAAMVETGEADLAPSIAVQDATNPETDFSYPNSETTRIRIGMDQPPLTDVRVRKALNLAVDRQAFVGTILGKDVQPASQLVVPSTSGYNPEMSPWAYDPEEAKKLLAEAKADGVPVEAEIRMVGRTNLFPNVNEVLQALVQMWQQVGLNVNLQMVDRAAALEMGARPFPTDRPPTLLTDQHNNDMGDASFTVVYKYSSQGAQSDTSNPELDKMIEAAARADGTERKELFEDAFQFITEEVVPDVMLFHMVGYARVSPRLEFEPTIATNSELQLSQIKFK